MLPFVRNGASRSFSALVGLATLLVTPEALSVAPRIGADPPGSRAFADFGWDLTWLMALGASREVLTNTTGLSVSIDVQTGWPVLLLPNGEVAAGATLYATAGGIFGMTLGAHPDLRLARDSTGTKLGLGSSFELRPGLYGERFTVALDVSASFVFTTYMHHSQAVRSLFDERYPGETRGVSGPKDGFYAVTSQRFRLGAAGGAVLSRTVALHGQLGFAYTPQLRGILMNPPHGPLPFYVAAGGQYRW
jgi:hypothetical protein